MPKLFPLDLAVLREVADYLNIGVYVTDVDRRIVLWNRKAAEITEHQAEDVVGRRCADNVLAHEDKNGDRL
ncbi:MAG: PAS domain-containing protein, partial [Planctomycetes bacterium]|nr:PAS domain-containing protein [Planctomycetota bacterium]